MSPKAAFDNIVERAASILALHGELAGGLAVPAAIIASQRAILHDDLLRSALVLAVAALDRYVHDRVTKGIAAAYRRGNLNREQEEFSIPVSLAFEIAARATKAQGDPKQSRHANLVRNEVQEILHKRPFQSWREIEVAFLLIGISGLAGHIQNAAHLGNMGPYKNQLNDIVRTRNLIVHEGHIRRHQRGGKSTLLEITSASVTEATDFLKGFVGHLEAAT
jgi:RiboL-PSP-HEPN